MKRCFKCNNEKPLSEFYKHKAMADGHLNKCKECTRLDVRKHRAENDSVREYDRNRGNRQSGEYLREFRGKNPEKYKAHAAVNNAVRDGRLIKSTTCETCGSDGIIHGHHDDYSKPLVARWLCARCHAIWHAENGKF